MEYLTPEDFKIAAANGIKYSTAYSRFYSYGWSKEDAITKTVTKRSEALWPRYKERAEAIGLTQDGFYSRIKKYGMTLEEAVTRPVARSMSELSYKRKNLKTNKELADKAAQNGIGYSTFMRRIHVLKWDIERATTEPIGTSAGKKGWKSENHRIGPKR
jgi:hypothetical protein